MADFGGQIPSPLPLESVLRYWIVITRLKLVLKSKLNGRNKILAINIWAVSLLRYTGGIIRWNKDDLLEMDRRTRKLMTMNGALHTKSDINRIYIPRRRGEGGLISA